MSRAFTFAFPGRLDLKTGGYAYDRRVMAAIGAFGFRAEPMALGEGFPAPDMQTLSDAQARLSGLADGTVVLIDGLAFGILGGWAEREAKRLRIVALVHHPLALETGLDSGEQARLRDSERRALAAARHVIVTSPMTARELTANFGVGAERLTVALPGTDPARLAAGGNAPPHIVSIGTLTRRKGHDVLLRALKRIETLDWRATVIGSRDLDPPTAQALIDLAVSLRLEERVEFAGECEDTREVLASADIFALASRYEGYGMVFAEALSQGLPVVACHAGAVPDVVPKEAGILVPVDDFSGFAEALRHLLTDPHERQARAKAALTAGLALPRWPDTARIVAGVLDRVA